MTIYNSHQFLLVNATLTFAIAQKIKLSSSATLKR